MVVLERGGQWVISHGGRTVAARFESEDEAWSWADRNIDDQVFDHPNQFSPPIKYDDNTEGLWEPEIIRELRLPDRGRIVVVRAPQDMRVCRPGQRIMAGGEELLVTGLEYMNGGKGPRPGERIGLVVRTHTGEDLS